jgi:hypothetical protein
MPMRKYEPNDRDREIVHRLAATGLARELIAFAITNERTGRAINRRTLEKNFGKELETAKVAMADKTMTAFMQMIEEKNWPAVRTGLSNYCQIRDTGEGVVVNANSTTKVSNEPMQIVFVRSPNADAPVDGPRDLGLAERDYRALPPPAEIPIAPEPVANPEPAIVGSSPNHIGEYRTEMDDPNNPNLPWYKRRSSTRRIPRGKRL